MTGEILPGDLFFLTDKKTVIKVVGPGLCKVALGHGRWGDFKKFDRADIAFKLTGGAARAYVVQVWGQAKGRKAEIRYLLDAGLKMGLGGTEWEKDMGVELTILKALWQQPKAERLINDRLLAVMTGAGGARQEMWEHYSNDGRFTSLRLVTKGQDARFQKHACGYYQMNLAWLNLLVDNGIEWAGKSYKGQAHSPSRMLQVNLALGRRKNKPEMDKWLAAHPE